MDTVKSLNKWANAHTNYPLDLLRIGLGIFLIVKGISFITNRQYLSEIMNTAGLGGEFFLIHYIAAAHMMGGLMIAFGLLTRWSVAAQLPILIGAVVVNFTGSMNLQNFVLATLTLVLCVFFLIYGSGKHSADYYFKMQQ